MFESATGIDTVSKSLATMRSSMSSNNQRANELIESFVPLRSTIHFALAKDCRHHLIAQRTPFSHLLFTSIGGSSFVSDAAFYRTGFTTLVLPKFSGGYGLKTESVTVFLVFKGIGPDSFLRVLKALSVFSERFHKYIRKPKGKRWKK